MIAAAFLVALVATLVLWGAKPAEAAFPGSNGKVTIPSIQVLVSALPFPLKPGYATL